MNITTIHTHNRLIALCLGQTEWASIIRRNIHPLTPILIIRDPLSTSSTYYNPQHPPCSMYAFDSPFPQPLSRSSWSGILYFILNAFLHPVVIFFSQQMPIPLQTVFTVIPMLCHLFLISLSAPYLKICLLVNATHPSDYSHLCSLKCHLIFFPYRPNITIITK